MKLRLELQALSIALCLLCVLPCSATTSGVVLQDQKVRCLLDKVLHSDPGRRIKPASVIYVTPSVCLPGRPRRHISTNVIYLVTTSKKFYSVYLTPNRVILEWQSNLVPGTDKAAMKPAGPLGELLETLGERLLNHASVGEHGVGVTFLDDVDASNPLVLYHLVKGRLVRDGE